MLAWSLLYYRYVRVDLNLKPPDLEHVLSVDPRTLRRYLNFAVQRLTEHLVKVEWEARRQQRKRWLHSALRAAPALPMIGRDEVLEQVRLILQGRPPHRILVTGMRGIGKSALIHEVIRQRINLEQIDRLIWLDAPVSVDFVRHYVNEVLVPPASKIACREYLLLYRTAIVLDGIESLLEDKAAVEDLLDYLSPAEVYLTSKAYTSLDNITVHIPLSPLTRSDAEKLAVASVGSGGRPLTDKHMSLVWDRVGGNPLAIIRSVRSLASGINDISDSVHGLHDQLYESLPDEARRAWCFFALLPGEGMEAEQLSAVLRLMGVDSAPLQRHHLMERPANAAEAPVLSASAGHYIQVLYAASLQPKSIIDGLLKDLDSWLNSFPLEFLDIAEHILIRKWPPIDPERRRHWLKTLWRHGLRQGRHAHWRVILEQVLEEIDEADPDLYIAYGICLRRVGEWLGARKAFGTAIVLYGQKGMFLEQAKALLEMGILYRYQGLYNKTLTLLKRAEKIALRTSDQSLSDVIREELAQIHIDQGDPEGAQAYLADIRSENGRTLTLLGEANLLAGNPRRCRAAAARALKVLAHDKLATARIHMLLGRAYYLEKAFDEAHDYCAASLSLLEMCGDVFGLARARSNLATVLMQTGNYLEAYRLLKLAEETQLELGDRVTLVTIRHNMRLLEALLASS